jgi:hypothetical protein
VSEQGGGSREGIDIMELSNDNDAMEEVEGEAGRLLGGLESWCLYMCLGDHTWGVFVPQSG